MAVETFFLITINEDGSLTSHTKLPEEDLGAQRVASTYDVYQSAKQIVEQFETQMLVDRITKSVVGALQPPVTNVSNIVADALKERGINPESVTPAE